MKTPEIVAALEAIQKQILSQIPYPPNRATSYYINAASNESSVSHLDYPVRYSRADYLVSLHEYLKEQFNAYCKQSNFKVGSVMPARDRAHIVDEALIEAKSYFKKLRLIASAYTLDQVEKNLNLPVIINDLIDKLCKGEELELDDEVIADIYRKKSALTEYRAIIDNEIEANEEMMDLKEMSDELHHTITKTNCFIRGAIIERLQVNTGFCEEYTCLAIKKIFDNKELVKYITVEKISIDYGYDGHTFLAINRWSDRDIKDIQNWGDNDNGYSAILYDPWANIICETRNFNKILKSYFYDRYAKWVIEAVFGADDKKLLKQFVLLNLCFQITGTGEFKDRLPRLMEEYDLTSLDDPAFIKTKTFLQSMLDAAKPAKFKRPAACYLTATGNEYVTHLLGFNEPVIAVHVAAMRDLMSGAMTQEELKFALACEFEYFQLQGIGINSHINMADQTKIDNNALTRCKNPHAAISYLRKAYQFSKDNKPHVRLPLTFVNNYTISSYEQRIKTLMTLLACKEMPVISGSEIALDEKIAEELAPVKKRHFFKDEFDRKSSRLDKIHYLASCLPELRIELLPEELTDQSAKRARDWVALYRELAIDFKNSDEIEAASELVNTAYHLRLPCFNTIYYGATRDENNQLPLDRPPLIGPLRDLQKLLTLFESATTKEEAKNAAIMFFTRFTELNNLFQKEVHWSSALQYTHQYQLEHGVVPTGDKRFYQFRIGWDERYKVFENQSGETPPWQKHLEWFNSSDDAPIAELLCYLGINFDPRLWHAMPYKKLFEMIKTATKFDIIIDEKFKPAKYKGSYEKFARDIVRFITSSHPVDASMFLAGSDFEAAFCSFYDKNYLGLISPGLHDYIQVDNEATNILLREFTRIAKSGTDKEKAVVKSFFSGREDKRDLKNLYEAYVVVSYTDFNRQNLYFQFMVYERYKLTTFDLFSAKDKILFMAGYYWHPQITAKDLLNIYKNPANVIDRNYILDIFRFIGRDLDHTMNRGEIVRYFFLLYIDSFGKPPMLSPEVFQMMGVDQELARCFQVTQMQNILKNAQWSLSDKDEIKEINYPDVALLYRAYDHYFLFPSFEEQEKFGAILIELISAPNNCFKELMLERLLFRTGRYNYAPLSRIQFFHALADIWIEHVAKKWGKDVNKQNDVDQLKATITSYGERLNARDKISLLSRLATAMQVQPELGIHFGTVAEPSLFTPSMRDFYANQAISAMSKISSIFENDDTNVTEFLDFISRPLSAESLNKFSKYVVDKNLTRKIGNTVVGDGDTANNMKNAKDYLRLLYHSFWDRPLEERCVMLDHILIPATKTVSKEEYKKAYDRALTYIASRLFPLANKANTDDEFALAFLKSYLNSTDEFQRSLMMAGLLAASNKTDSDGAKLSPAKVLAMLCEYLGPAYIKFAQAIHSHPGTPPSIREELNHVKSKANPPHRWNLMRVMREVVPKYTQEMIVHIGELLGSASYNYAMLVTLQHGKKAVLSLQRENARKDATRGFKQLQTAIKECDHSRMVPMRSALLSMLHEAEIMSELELDHEASRKQYRIARDIYRRQTHVDGYKICFKPAKIITLGRGYRIIDFMEGQEFNLLPADTADDKRIRNLAAKAVYALELQIILSGKRFDSDRHGNQLRIKVDEKTKTMDIGLYDFGEIALEKPTNDELKQLADVFKNIPGLLFRKLSFSMALDTALSTQINIATNNNTSARYLMRVRKALLALQDFQKALSTLDLIDILLQVIEARSTHALFQDSLKHCVEILKGARLIYGSTIGLFGSVSALGNSLTTFEEKSSELKLNK